MISFLDAIFDKTLRSTVALLANRGRGKSAALGLAIAGAVAAGCVTSSSLTNDIQCCTSTILSSEW